MNARLRELCASQVAGDTYRNLRIEPEYSGQTFKHILVAVWLLSYHYRGKVYQLIANGHSGAIAGEYPKSPWKIAALGLLALVLVGVLGWALL